MEGKVTLTDEQRESLIMSVLSEIGGSGSRDTKFHYFHMKIELPDVGMCRITVDYGGPKFRLSLVARRASDGHSIPSSESPSIQFSNKSVKAIVSDIRHRFYPDALHERSREDDWIEDHEMYLTTRAATRKVLARAGVTFSDDRSDSGRYPGVRKIQVNWKTVSLELTDLPPKLAVRMIKLHRDRFKKKGTKV